MDDIQPIATPPTGTRPSVTNQPAHTPDPGGVVSEDMARALGGGQLVPLGRTASARTGEVEVRTGPPAQTHAQALNASIEAKIQQITRPKVRNQAHMIDFLKLMQGYDADAPEKTRSALLRQATPHFMQAYYDTLQEIEGPQNEAGEWLNMHNWGAEALALTPTLAAAVAQLVTAKQAMSSMAPGDPLPTPSAIPPALALTGSVINLFVNPMLAKRWLQPALTQQRIIRTITPTRAGGAVDVDKTITDLKEAHRQAQQLLRDSEAGPDLAAIEAAEEASRSALKNHAEASGTTRQRRQLYMPENYIRVAKALAILTAVWNIYGTSDEMKSRLVPIMLIYQVVSYVLGWVANYKWAGPKRDALLRDGAMQVDFAKEGPSIARRLAAEGGGEITTVDEAAWEWGRSVYKSQKEVRIEMTQALVQEQIDNALDEMAELLAMPPSDTAQLHALQIKNAEQPDDMVPDDHQTLQALQASFGTAEAAVQARTAVPQGEQESPATRYAAKRQEYETLKQDRLHLKTMLEAAAMDEPSDAWKQLSPSSKEWLDLALSEHETQNFAARYWQYMFKGSKSHVDTIRFAHAVADAVRHDWRNYDPDAFLKFGKAVQMGVGGSLMPLILAAAFGLSSSTGKAPHVALRAVFSAIPFLLYVGCEIHQGTAVNATIMQREFLKTHFLSRKDSAGWFALYGKQAWDNMWRLPEEVLRITKGSMARGNTVGDIATLESTRRQLEQQQLQQQLQQQQPEPDEEPEPAASSASQSRA